ncbi:MAG: peptide chain release factor N(5)-glutamine methyltransferase [Natronincolaceae bacterium]|jgi:release factor glutamine methyltransferase|nr:peptide chain release factor N(5)-glutamine methyltransferase [Bacillota bacterium]
MVTTVTIGHLLREGMERLKEANIPTPGLDAEVLLYNLLGVERIYLYMYREKEVSKEIQKEFWIGIEKRAKHMPIQYIVNRQEFMGLDFWVEKGVLIPRADTEILVEKIIDIYKSNYYPHTVRIMDIGTGSGAIAVSLAKYIDNCIITAIDICPNALKVAVKNADFHKVKHKIMFYSGNLFEPINKQDEYGTYDFIVSNPPYIPKSEIKTLGSNVKDYEPCLALDGGEDGLDYYKKITPEAKHYLKKGGWLLFEIGYSQGKDVSKILNINGFKNIDILKDLAGLDRVAIGAT